MGYAALTHPTRLHRPRGIAEPVIGRAFARPVGSCELLPNVPAQSADGISHRTNSSLTSAVPLFRLICPGMTLRCAPPRGELHRLWTMQRNARHAIPSMPIRIAACGFVRNARMNGAPRRPQPRRPRLSRASAMPTATCWSMATASSSSRISRSRDLIGRQRRNQGQEHPPDRGDRWPQHRLQDRRHRRDESEIGVREEGVASVARMSAAISGTGRNVVPDVAALIRATAHTSAATVPAKATKPDHGCSCRIGEPSSSKRKS